MKNVPGPESLLFVGCMHKIPSESHRNVYVSVISSPKFSDIAVSVGRNE